MGFHQKPYTYTGEVYLKVSDLDKSVCFYKEVIGFKVLEEAVDKVIFTANGHTPLLIIEQPKNVTAKERGRTGLFHFALLLPKRTDLGKIIVHFAQNNIAIGAGDHKVSEAIYLSDPDGNGIEIYIDRDADTWEWSNGEVAMTTDPIDTESIVAESAGQVWEGLPVETVMGHVHLHVENLEQAKLFYNALGFEVVSRIPEALFMSTGKYHHHIGMNTWNGIGAEKPSENSVGLSSFTLIYPDKVILENAVSRIQMLKINIEKALNGFETEDTSGNRILLRV